MERQGYVYIVFNDLLGCMLYENTPSACAPVLSFISKIMAILCYALCFSIIPCVLPIPSCYKAAYIMHTSVYIQHSAVLQSYHCYTVSCTSVQYLWIIRFHF